MFEKKKKDGQVIRKERGNYASVSQPTHTNSLFPHHCQLSPPSTHITILPLVNPHQAPSLSLPHHPDPAINTPLSLPPSFPSFSPSLLIAALTPSPSIMTRKRERERGAVSQSVITLSLSLLTLHASHFSPRSFTDPYIPLHSIRPCLSVCPPPQHTFHPHIPQVATLPPTHSILNSMV